MPPAHAASGFNLLNKGFLDESEASWSADPFRSSRSRRRRWCPWRRPLPRPHRHRRTRRLETHSDREPRVGRAACGRDLARRNHERAGAPALRVNRRQQMRQQLKRYLLALCVVLSVTPKTLADRPQPDALTTIDVPGASFTSAQGINAAGDIVGNYSS